MLFLFVNLVFTNNDSHAAIQTKGNATVSSIDKVSGLFAINLGLISCFLQLLNYY